MKLQNGIIAATCAIMGLGFAAEAQEADLPANHSEFSNDHVNITVSIQSNIYTYHVKNSASSGIVAFEVAQHAAYNFEAPENWQIDSSGETFRAWTEIAANGIAPGQTGQFSMRVSSRGAVLGRAAARVNLESGQTAEVADVWAPAAEPKSYVALVAGGLLLIVLAHAAFIIAKDRRARRPSATV
ncbi:MAG: hypothetical protein JXN61_12475 [Sedimentisphaerales bacterium]|nr:hypothetical protein [Sedimentisphaerales bacterium]